MHPKRKQRLFWMIGILLGSMCALGLILFALNQNINLYYTPSEIYAHKTPLNHSFRVGGLVEKGSVQRKTNDLTVQFRITDNVQVVKVSYTGVLPDLFKEGQGIIVQGKFAEGGVIKAEQVLAKHGADYKPPAKNKM